MDQMYSNTAVVFGNLKDALLHYRYVIPMNAAGSIIGYFPDGSGPLDNDPNFSVKDEYRDAVNTLRDAEGGIYAFCPRPLNIDPEFRLKANALDSLHFAYMVRQFEGEEKYKEYLSHLGVKHPIEINIVRLRRAYQDFLTRFGLTNIPIDCSSFVADDAPSNDTSKALSIRSFQMVDTAGIPLSRIMEFRKDEDNMRKMRKFRLFAYTNYAGKTRSFVRDDLALRKEQYHEALKSLGLKTKKQNLHFLLRSKEIMGAGLAALYSMIHGAPDTFITAGAATVAGWKLLDFAIELSNQREDMLNLSKEHPVSYLEDVERALKQK